MVSNIQEFFKNKTLLLTGGTGFLGKVIIEKLLRTTEIATIYIIVRKKNGKDINERVEEIFKDVLFEKLHGLRPEPARHVKAIAGDCMLNNLGLSEADRQQLIESVNVVIHSAATVRFNEPLSNAVAINVQATVDIMNLAKQMKHLQAFIHISSAFANCLTFHLKETYYTEYLGSTADEVLKMKKQMNDDKLFDSLHNKLVGNFPNTYCYTKSLAEEAILTMSDDLPICIFRPGIIIPTSADPIPGWVDNLYGPMSIVYGGAIGVLRVMYGRTSANAGLVPVDFCANMILACAWQTSHMKIPQKPTKPPIYNLVPDEINSIKWGAYQGFVEEYGRKIPLSSMIWFPYLYFIENYYLYKLLCLIYHTIPGYIIDLILMSIGKKRRMTKMYEKIHKQCDMLRYFVSNEWTFDMSNTKALWNSMSVSDQQLYNFDMVTFDWSKYSINSLYGMRKYLAKEEPETIPKARKLLKRLYILDTIVHSVVYMSLFWLLWLIIKYITT